MHVENTSFDLRWELRGSGWATLTVRAGAEELRVITSYVGHGLQSFLRAAADLRIGSHGSWAWLPDEPQAHILLFAVVGADVAVRVLWVPDETAEDPWAGARTEWFGRVRLDAFLDAADRMGRAVLDEHGADGYRRRWRDMPFPHAELDLLCGELPAR